MTQRIFISTISQVGTHYRVITRSVYIICLFTPDTWFTRLTRRQGVILLQTWTLSPGISHGTGLSVIYTASELANKLIGCGVSLCLFFKRIFLTSVHTECSFIDFKIFLRQSGKKQEVIFRSRDFVPEFNHVFFSFILYEYLMVLYTYNISFLFSWPMI